MKTFEEMRVEIVETECNKCPADSHSNNECALCFGKFVHNATMNERDCDTINWITDQWDKCVKNKPSTDMRIRAYDSVLRSFYYFVTGEDMPR